jgi:arginyl-tRNA synthetase
LLNKTNNDLQQLIRDSILKYLKNKEIDFVSIPVIMLTTPKNPAHGHLSTNIALQLSAIISDAPSNIAQFIVQEIEKKKPGILDKIEVASPGFINFYFKNDVLYNILPEIITQKSQFGHSNIGQGEKVLVEFVSVNPTGPLHIGHGKCAVVGDSLSKILKAAGYEVSTEYYINDHGKQIDILGESVLVRYRQLLGEDIEFPANGYQGNYIVDLAKEIMNEYQEQFKGKNDQDTIHFFKDYAQERILKDIKEDLFSFGVQFDNWFSEQSLYTENKVHPVIERLKKEGFVYLNKGALWFKSTDFGDEKDRVVIRKDGEANILIDIWGADHHGYINRMKAAIQALGYTKDSFQVLLVQFVTLLQGGKAVGMSTRGGQFITLKDLLKEVGKDVARYFFLMYSHDSHTEFDLDIAKSQSMDNPVFYIQYAYARICSIIEKGQSKNIILIDQKKEQIDLKLLDKKEELELIKKMAYFKEVIERSALQRKPYLIASYLYELASLFHKYYTEYKVISEDRELSEARLYLIYAVKIVLENALTLLGIQAPEKM